MSEEYTKFKRYINSDDDTWHLVSHWTNSNTVYLDDGSRTLQEYVTWKRITESNNIGEGEIEIPSYAKEINIKINISGTTKDGNKVSDIILKLYLITEELYEDKEQSYRTGYFQTSTNGCGAIFKITKSTIKFCYSYLNETDLTSTTAWSVFCK